MLIDADVFDRLGSVLRHLVVGLLEHSFQIRVLGSDPRVDSLQLGPVSTLVHPRIRGPFAGQRIRGIAEQVSPPGPAALICFGATTYALASELAKELDAEVALYCSSLNNLAAFRGAAFDREVYGLAATGPLLQRLEREPGFAPERVELIRPGILASTTDVRAPQGERVPCLLCTAPYEAGSGVDLLVEAAAILRQREREFLLFLLGEGRREGALRKQARTLDLSGSVTFAQPGGDPTPAVESADVFVDPRVDSAVFSESLEAMGAGVAVVSFAGDVYDHLLADETACVCADESAKALADALEALIVDPSRRQQIAAGGLAYVRKHHTITGMASGVAEVVRRLTASRMTFPLKEAADR